MSQSFFDGVAVPAGWLRVCYNIVQVIVDAVNACGLSAFAYGAFLRQQLQTNPPPALLTALMSLESAKQTRPCWSQSTNGSSAVDQIDIWVGAVKQSYSVHFLELKLQKATDYIKESEDRLSASQSQLEILKSRVVDQFGPAVNSNTPTAHVYL
ncbi:hypothetical protein BJ741DRAFT_573013 [Chytriomyces cf. hyalinus JEL632]|nr:hypothetical protein BJ741DRAFT_573013 [Chytriomyces cf. hyalinus JEL632]